MKADEHNLSERKKQILKAIVEAHIAEGEPVGSKYILENRQLQCSSATIRNEMAELEAMGYLEQPHTSAGRVPSELGYRFYVDTLVEHYKMTAKEVMEINRTLQSKMAELDQILHVASRLASTMTNYTGFAMKPRNETASVQRFETIYIDEHNFVLVMVTNGNAVKTKSIKLADSLTEDMVTQLGKSLNDHMCGLLASEISMPVILAVEKDMGDGSAGIVNTVIKTIYSVINESDGGEMNLSGINRLLQYPEYSDVGQLQELLGTIENKEEIMDLVSSHNAGDDVNVLIGSETTVKQLNNSALVFKPIKKGNKTVGAIGIIGPVRMDYGKVLSTLEGIGDNIMNMLDSFDAQLPGGDDGGPETMQELKEDTDHDG